VSLKIYVEGGAPRNDALNSKCRNGFKRFFESAGLTGRLPRVIPCGPRSAAFSSFRSAVRSGQEQVLLLIDSEDAFGGGSPWNHVAAREGDQFERPDGVGDDQLHFMIRTMEAWLAADPIALAAYFGSGFRRDQLPAPNRIEDTHRVELVERLQRASRSTTKGSYDKGRDSYEILGRLNPAHVRQRCPSADRLLRALETLIR
jgi:hypothetical protein